MITPLLVIGIVLITIGAIIVLYSIYIVLKKDEPVFMLGLLIGILLFILAELFCVVSTPTKRDVINDRAHYVKELNVYDNDTVVTYRIEFNKKTPCQ